LSVKLGHMMMVAGMIGGGAAAPTMEAVITHRPNPIVLVLCMAAGAIAGVRGGYQLAPHEREARKVERGVPYQGIVTGTPNPNFETAKARDKRRIKENFRALRNQAPQA